MIHKVADMLPNMGCFVPGEIPLRRSRWNEIQQERKVKGLALLLIIFCSLRAFYNGLPARRVPVFMLSVRKHKGVRACDSPWSREFLAADGLKRKYKKEDKK